MPVHIRVAVAAFLVLAAAGCDPLAGVFLRTSIVPAPAPGCVDTALAALRSTVTTSPQKRTSYEEIHGEQDYTAVFLDGSRSTPGNLKVRIDKDSVAAIDLSFIWMGRLDNVPDTTRLWMAAQGRALLGEVIARCGKSPRDSVTCEQYALFERKSPAC